MNQKQPARKKRSSVLPTPEAAFAQIVRARRIELNLKQADLEGDEEIDRSYISRIESGKRQICLRAILHLSRKLQMSPGELMDQVERLVNPEGS